MRILFLHPNFPAQFRHLAATLGKEKGHQVVFGTKRKEGEIAGVYKVLYEPPREAHPQTHHYVKTLENAVLQGQAVYRLAEKLKSEAFIPDIVYGHSGWGPTLLMKDAFPRAKLLCYFEWFYNAQGSDADFDPTDPLSADDIARIRFKNAPILSDLYTCDRGLSPTLWQKQQFPQEYQDKITVLHDGVNTEFFQPDPGKKLVIPRVELDLTQAEEIVTYVARGMEPYRGFPQLIETIAILQERRPQCHFVIVGENRVAYGKTLPDGKTYKDVMLEKFSLDLSRVHFTGYLAYSEYLDVLKASSVHIYLTRPFVLSWSMLESMSTGCLIVGSNTDPVKEVIQDGVNGLLVDFFSPNEIADRVEEVLNHPDRMEQIRVQARETILKKYDLAKLLPQHLKWIETGEIKKSKLSSAGKNKKKKSFIKDIEKLNSEEQIITKTSEPGVLQINDRNFNGQEILSLLDRYQMLPQLIQQVIIDEAIAGINNTLEEEKHAYNQFRQQNNLADSAALNAWLQSRNINLEQLQNSVRRSLKIEKFKQTTWKSELPSYFQQRQKQLSQITYSMVRVEQSDLIQELHSRIEKGESSFADLAQQYSQGHEALTGGKIGPVSLSSIHPTLAKILTESQPGQLLSPVKIGQWYIIAKLEESIAPQLDAQTSSQLLNELFNTWLQQQVKQKANFSLRSTP